MPPGACQVSGNQSEWLILPAHAQKKNQPEMLTHTHTHTYTSRAYTCSPSVLSALLFFILSRFIGLFRPSCQSVAP